MTLLANPVQWILGLILLASSLGVILARKPVHSSLFFLVTLLALSALYLHLSAQFIAVMQILVYAGAIMVIFMFVIVLFQDAYSQISQHKAQSSPPFLIAAGGAFLLALIFLGSRLTGLKPAPAQAPEGFGTVEALGKAIYIDFFFPFEAIILLFLVAMVGALYIGKKEQ